MKSVPDSKSPPAECEGSTHDHAAHDQAVEGHAHPEESCEIDESACGCEHDASPRTQIVSVAVSGALTAGGLVLDWLKFDPASLRYGCFISAIVAGAWVVFPSAIRSLGKRKLDINVLMMVAVTGAVIIGEWAEAAGVTFLFALSELLESFSAERARRAIRALLQLTPEVASVQRDGTFREVPVANVKAGEIVAIKSGARIPLDGVVTRGSSSVNQAPITGESLPVEKEVGAGVFAGTINGDGALEVRVSKLAGDSTLAKIVRLVEDAQKQKATTQRFVDVFARFYTPSVFVAALLVFFVPPLLFGAAWNVWTYRALVLLVIACPCALVIATPVSIVSGLTAMARRGVLIKGGAHLEAVGQLRALALDKTGTITEGRPSVSRVVRFAAADDAEVLKIAAAIDVHSEHPLARAIVARAVELGVAHPRGEDYRALSGHGAEATIGGIAYFIGNHRFVEKEGVCSPEVERVLQEIEAEALSVVVVARRSNASQPGAVLGVLAVGDTIRPNARAAVAALHAAGIERVVMLSGDNQRTADAVARQVGIDEASGDLLPEDRIERVRALLTRYGKVGMVGDGVNDAPAMAAATVGIAMGAAGTDTAIETADMALMQDDLSKVAEAIQLGRRTLSIVRFNIIFALTLKAVFLVLNFAGHASLWLAILADTGATLLVIANALRLLRSSPQANPQPRGSMEP